MPLFPTHPTGPAENIELVNKLLSFIGILFTIIFVKEG
jgi:hypothetical protein